MTTLIEKSILNERLEKSRSGTYADTSENRRKHRVGQKYGSEKKEEEKPEKTDPNKMSPEQQLEAINKVIAAVNEGKLKLPPEEINTLVAKKTMAEEAVKQAKGEKKPEKKEEPKKEEVNNLQRRKELSEKVERLISEKKKKFPNPDIESPMSDEEKRLTKEIADTWSEINKLIQENRKSKEESKSEPKQGETEESYTRVKFEDVPNSGKVNLKKYLSEKVRKGVDEKWSNIKNIPTDNLKKMEKGLVNDLNKNFEAIKKSQRAELLYSIMKVKGELESRGKETSKEGSKESGKLSDLQSKVPGYMNMPEYKKYISVKSEVDNFGKVPSGGDKRQRYDELNEQLVEATKKYKEALKKKLTT